jgi:hypothetical protein
MSCENIYTKISKDLGEKKAKCSGNQRTEIMEHVLKNEEKRKLWDDGLPERESYCQVLTPKDSATGWNGTIFQNWSEKKKENTEQT